LPSAVIFSTNLAAHLVFFVSTNAQFLQSFFFVHCNPDHFAILHSILGEDTIDLPVAAAVAAAAVEAAPQGQQLVVAQLVAAAALPERQVRRHIAVAVVQEPDTSSLELAAGRIEYVA